MDIQEKQTKQKKNKENKTGHNVLDNTMHKQTHINNTNKTWTLLQGTGGNEEPNIDIIMLDG
jgi:hypothetical protein